MRPIQVLFALLCLACLPTLRAQTTPPYYLALGDSLAKGEQWGPNGDTYYHGYAEDLAPQIQLPLVNLGCGSETTATMINGGICSYVGSPSQLAAAEDFIRHHPVGLVTIDIGADDYSTCSTSGGYDAACLLTKTIEVVANLQTILAGLREAGGSHLQIIAINYYDPYLADYFNGSTGPLVATTTLTAIVAFNEAETTEYKAYSVQAADVATAFQSANLLPVMYDNQPVPTNVVQICNLTWMCMHGNIHANTAGYQRIADTLVPLVSTRFPVSNAFAAQPAVHARRGDGCGDGPGVPWLCERRKAYLTTRPDKGSDPEVSPHFTLVNQ